MSAEEVIQESENWIESCLSMEAEIEDKPPRKYEYIESIFHEIVRYHHEYKPNENCDMIFERIEEVPK